MANPNIVGVTEIFGKTICDNLTASLASVIGAVPTGDVYKVNSILCCNIDTADRTVDIKINKATGDDCFLVKGLTIPTGATLDVLNKPIYLEEGDSLEANSDVNAKVDMTVSYEDIA